MTPSKDCFDLISHYEGLVLHAYPDPATGAEPWTIGYGHTGKVKPDDCCTQQQATEWMNEDANETAKAIQKAVTVPLTQPQLDALTSLCYNIGMGNFKRSTLLKKLNKEDYAGASDEFLKWTYANGKQMPGLVARRKSEQALFDVVA